MDAAQVKTFCDIAAQLIVPLATYAGTEVDDSSPADDTLVRQLRVAGGAINDALSQVARLTPPTPPPMPPADDVARARDGAMTDGDIRAIADRILLKVVQDHPDVASEIAALLLSEILGACLFGGGDEGEVDDFVAAINLKLAEIALHHGAASTWHLVPAEPPKRH